MTIEAKSKDEIQNNYPLVEKLPRRTDLIQVGIENQQANMLIFRLKGNINIFFFMRGT